MDVMNQRARIVRLSSIVRGFTGGRPKPTPIPPLGGPQALKQDVKLCSSDGDLFKPSSYATVRANWVYVSRNALLPGPVLKCALNVTPKSVASPGMDGCIDLPSNIYDESHEQVHSPFMVHKQALRNVSADVLGHHLLLRG